MEKSKIIDEYGVNLYEIKSMFNDVEKAINEVLFDLEDKLDQIYGDKNINKGRSKCLYFQSKLKSEDKDKINQFFCNDIKKKNKKVLLIKC